MPTDRKSLQELLEWSGRAYATVSTVYRQKLPSERPFDGSPSVEIDWTIENEDIQRAGAALFDVQYDFFIEHKDGVTEEDVRIAWRIYYRLHLRTWSGINLIPDQRELIQQ